MKAFALGRYVPYDSWIHRLDPRLKILGTILLMVCVFFNYGTWSMRYLMMGVLFLVISLLVWRTKLSFRDLLGSLRHLWFMVVFLLIIYIFLPNGNHVLPEAWNCNGWIVYWDSFAEAGRILLRLVMMVEPDVDFDGLDEAAGFDVRLGMVFDPVEMDSFPGRGSRDDDFHRPSLHPDPS